MAQALTQAQTNKQTLAVVITDSRGSGLQDVIHAITPGHITVKVLAYPGRGIISAVKESEKLLNWWQPSQIYIMNGICNITRRDRETKKVSLREISVETAVSAYVQSMDIVTHFIKILLDGKKYQLIFTEIVGMDMATYNGTTYPHHQQSLLNSTIHGVNAEITAWNNARNVITPWLAKEIHRNKKNGQKITRYHKLSEDGLHLTSELRSSWAKLLIQAICKNIEKEENKATEQRKGLTSNIVPPNMLSLERCWGKQFKISTIRTILYFLIQTKRHSTTYMRNGWIDSTEITYRNK